MKPRVKRFGIFWMWDFFDNLCDKKLLLHNKIFASLVEKTVDVLLCQVNLLTYLLGKTS